MSDMNTRGQAIGQPLPLCEKLVITSEFHKSVFEKNLVFNLTYLEGW